nr:hypothetical protein [Hyphomonas sp. Mor2]
MSTYNCRVCGHTHAITHELNCLSCGAEKPWASDEDLKKWEMYDYWLAEEQKHARAYQSLIDQFMGSMRFKKQIRHHVDLANKAQDEKNKYR